MSFRFALELIYCDLWFTGLLLFRTEGRKQANIGTGNLWDVNLLCSK